MASSDTPPAGDRDVFSGLPNARPQRRSAKRDRSEKAPQARAAVSSKPAADKPAKPRKKAAPKPKAPPVPPAGYATPVDDDRPHGTDLVGTAVQAAGELAQIGIAAGGRALKSAIQRLPRP
jgi:sRNA-binding protein